MPQFSKRNCIDDYVFLQPTTDLQAKQRNDKDIFVQLSRNLSSRVKKLI